MSSPYPTKVARKQIRLRASASAAETLVHYPDAIALVRKERLAGRYKAGLYYLEQIEAQMRAIAEPGLYLLSVYLDGMLIDEAAPIARRLLKKFPRDPQVLYHCSRFRQQSNDIEGALELVSYAISLYPRSAENYELHGQLLRSTGDTDGALQAFEQALDCDPENSSALLGKARILGANCKQEFIQRIESLIDSAALRPLALAQLHYAMAWIHERGDVGAHFNHLDSANAAMAAIRPSNPGATSKLVDRIVSRYRGGKRDEDSATDSAGMSPIFIASLPRSGSTLLEQMLGMHSAITPIGESGAFMSALQLSDPSSAGYDALILPTGAAEIARRSADIAAAFHNNFFVREQASGRILDKSIPNYLSVGAILEVFPKARILVLSRHPLDVVYSCYKQDFASGFNASFNLEHLALVCRDFGRLADHWAAHYGGRVLSVNYEDLVCAPEQTIRQVLDYCQLQWEAQCLEFQKNIGLIKTASDIQVREPLNSRAVNSWRRVEDYLEPARKILDLPW